MRSEPKEIKLTASQVKCLERLCEARYQFPTVGMTKGSCESLVRLGLAIGDLRLYSRDYSKGRLVARRAYCRTAAGTAFLERM